MKDVQHRFDESTAKKVSVVIVNWNGERYLESCLRSVLNQSYTNYEVILVDNASTDRSLSLIEREFPGVLIVKNTTNQGFAAGNNSGIRLATGDYVATLNNDTVAEPDWLEQLVKVVEGDPSIGMAASLMLFHHWPEVINSTGISLDKAGIAWDRLGGKTVDHSETLPVEVFGPCAGAALYKREMLEDVGLFDETFFMYLEDVDLAWRARLRGWRCLYVPTAQVYHVHSGTSVEGSTFKNHLLARNKVWTTIKNYPTPELYLYLPAILLYDLITVPYAVLTRGNVATLMGRLEGLRTMGTALRKRSEIQQGRRVTFKELATVMDRLVSPLVLYRRYRHLDQLLRKKLDQP